MGPKHTGKLWVYIGTPLPNPSGNTGVMVCVESPRIQNGGTSIYRQNKTVKKSTNKSSLGHKLKAKKRHGNAFASIDKHWHTTRKLSGVSHKNATFYRIEKLEHVYRSLSLARARESIRFNSGFGNTIIIKYFEWWYWSGWELPRIELSGVLLERPIFSSRLVQDDDERWWKHFGLNL